MATFHWAYSSFTVQSFTGQLANQRKNHGINWTWKSLSDVSKSGINKDLFFAWQFEWDELKKQGIEIFEGTIKVSYYKACSSKRPSTNVPGFPKIFSVELTRSGQWVEHCIGSEKDVGELFTCNNVYFQCIFDMKSITNSDEARVSKETFAASDKTDAILVVEGKKLHVNKQFLSFHSEYFNTLFNSEFKEKSMDEIPIEDVKYEDFSRLLSIVHLSPIFPTVETSTSLLELADRFIMPTVTNLVEPFLIRNESMRICEKIALADKYALKELLETCLDSMKTAADIKKITETPYFEELSDATKVKLFYKTLPLLSHVSLNHNLLDVLLLRFVPHIL